MLVLTRRKDERINIGPDIQVVVLAVKGNHVRLGLIAPAEIPIRREELAARIEWEGAGAGAGDVVELEFVGAMEVRP